MVSEGLSTSIDYARLFRLRLAVARRGEMDAAGWWNTQGVLGRTGGLAIRRGLPKTHHFAQARLVFAVATARCRELYEPPAGSLTLWQLPAEIEDGFERNWHDWLRNRGDWAEEFDLLVELPDDDLSGVLIQRGLLSSEAAAKTLQLEPTAGGRALDLGDVPSITDDLLARLAAAFAVGRKGELVVPFARTTG